MSMSKRDFIYLADVLKPFREQLSEDVIAALCYFMRSSNPRFMKDRWLSYLAGECGPNGGKVK